MPTFEISTLIKKRVPMLLGALLVCSAIAASGCGEGGSGSDSGPEIRPFTGVNSDFTPAESPRELGEQSDLVVRGETGEPQTGRIWGASPEDPGAIETLVIPIHVTNVEAGELPAGSNETVYLEVFASAGAPRQSIIEGAAEEDGLFFLTETPEVIPETTEIVDPDSGRPEGQPLYQAATPQGLLLEEESSGDIWSVGEEVAYPGVDLDSFLPTEDQFPPADE